MTVRIKKYVSKNGFTLIEVMAAVAILSIGLIGGLTVINYNLKNISFTKNRIIAGGLAAEGIEFVRNIRDTNWLESAVNWKQDIEGVNPSNEAVKFFCGNPASVYKITPLPSSIDDATRCSGSGVNRPCQIYIYTDGTGNSCYSDNFNDRPESAGYTAMPTNFFRFIKLTELTSDSLEVKVDVKWVSGTQSFKVTATEVLYNWK